MYATPSPPPYAVLETSQHYGHPPPPPYHPHRSAPRYPYKRSNGGGSCCRCICCCCCFIFILLLIQLIVLFSLYYIYDPQIPTYKVENLDVKSFDIMPDFSLNTEFLLSVRAENPNRNIGFIYGDNSWVVVTYSDASLCNGKVPSFRQGAMNTTVMKIDLKGKSEFGSGMQQALQDGRKNHRIPLLVRLKVPVSIVLGEIPLREINVFVNCSLVLDNLAPNTKVGILSKETTFSIEL